MSYVLCPLYNVVTANKFTKTRDARQSYCFVHWTYVKKICEWGPVYIEKIFLSVTLPARVNLSKC